MIQCGVCQRVFDPGEPWNVKVIICHRCREKGTSIVFSENEDEFGERHIGRKLTRKEMRERKGARRIKVGP